MVRPAFGTLAVLTAVVAACGAEPTPPGTLAITLNTVPAATATLGIDISGQVLRTPPAPDVPIVVSLTVGSTVRTDTAASTGAFAFAVSLTPNSDNTMSLAASDATGSTAPNLQISVLHDAVGPTVSGVTPSTETIGVTPGTPIVVTLSEAAAATALGGVVLQRGGINVPVTATLAADGRTLTVAPGSGLVGGAAYRLRISSLRDSLGNVQAGAFESCFLTSPDAGAFHFTDPAADHLAAGSPAALSPPDLLNGWLAVSGGVMDGVLRFQSARQHAPGAPNSLFGVIDLDLDQDSTTGVPTFKDAALDGILPSSGTRAEYMIGLGPLASLGDSAFAGRKTDTTQVEVLHAFLPVACGAYYGFSIPMAALGDDLEFNMVGYFVTADQSGLYDDAAPDSSHYTAMITAAPAPPAHGVAGPTPAGAGRGRFVWRRDPRSRP